MPSLNARLLLALVASLLLYFADTRLNYFVPVRAVLSTLVYPFQTIATVPTSIKEWAQTLFQDRNDLKQKIAVLEATNLLNSARLQKLQALERENMRLRELLGSSFRLNERVLVAELLTIDMDPFSQQVVIDKGKQYGVFSGQAILDATGVMGQVIEVGPFSSRAILLTDPNHAIPVQINRNGLRAIATGRGLGKPLQLEHLPYSADVRVGDLIVTSGFGGRFPNGYPVGTVRAINYPEGQAFADIQVTPAAKVETSREVLLVLPTQNLTVSTNGEPLEGETAKDLPSGDVAKQEPIEDGQ
ncbi:MAG: rod shape-determining protein MreC [Gammaproteobacteria bacterium]|nr:rod shape-determining protein MreC [Gammaproteobacteria bacterium]